MSEIPASAQGGKSFSEWQPIYAERGITLIPCGPNKTPLVKNPQKFGRDASREVANKFSDASAFGYYCGRRNGITVLDVDTTDERVLSDAMYRHGQTPIVVRTGSGKFHALYRHNNERRSIRAWDGLPIDLLGAGLAIAPPSLVAKGQYQIIEGHLDDLDRLPILRELDARRYANASGPRPQRQGEGRNNDLWKRVMREAHHVDDFDQLLDRAETLNQEYVEPMQISGHMGGADKLQKCGAEDKRVFYEARYTMVGFLTRASFVCGGDKHDFNIAFSLLNPDELKAFSRAFPDTTRRWMQQGTNLFNTGVMKDGIPAACDFALKTLQKAKDIVQKDKQSTGQ